MSPERVTYKVRVAPWEHGSELHIAGMGVTQATRADSPEEIARDFIALERDVPAGSFEVVFAEAVS